MPSLLSDREVLLAPQPAHKTLLAMNIGESPLPMGHPQKHDSYPLQYLLIHLTVHSAVHSAGRPSLGR